MACRVLPPRSVHPLAAILPPHNGLLVSGGKISNEPGQEKRERGRVLGRDEAGCLLQASELSYSCYDLLSLKSFSLSSFSFLDFALFSFTLKASGGFYLSNEPLILFFFFFSVTSFVLVGRQYLSNCQAGSCIWCACACLHVWTAAELSGVKCLHHGSAGVGVESGRRGQRSLARWPRSPCCTHSFINMQHSGRFTLDLIALIGWTHLHKYTRTHTHILQQFWQVVVAPNVLLL